MCLQTLWWDFYSDSITIINFADDTVVVGLISDNIEKACLEEVAHLENWCQENNLSVNVSKTKELIVDFGRKQEEELPTPQDQRGPNGDGGELQIPRCLHHRGFIMVLSHQHLGKESRQHLYHLRHLRDHCLVWNHQ